MANYEEVTINATSFSSPSALFINLKTKNLQNIRTLIDSGASDCFIDSRFALASRLQLSNLKTPLRLSLFDGSIATQGLISQSTTLDVSFPCGTHQKIRLLLTPLARSTAVVLGYSWLRQHNPLINWVTHELTFRPWSPSDSVVDASCSTPPSALPELSLPHAPSENPISPSPVPLSSPLPSDELQAAAAKIAISFVSPSALGLMSRLPRSHPQAILCSGFIEPPTCNARLAVPEPDSPGLDPALASEYTSLRPQIPEAYHQYLDVFSKQKAVALPPRRPYDHSIALEDGTTPPFGPIYSLSEVEQLALRTFLDENLANEFIRPSQSSAGAPVLFIKKKDGSLRLAVDYRSLNRITKKDRYPLPLIPDLLDCLRSARSFTKIDLRGAYNLVRIADGDEWKTTFRTRYGSYEFQVMHYGLTNAPASFQRFMNDVFKDLLDICVVVYLDDILIYSDDPASHSAHVLEVLRRLRANNLYAKLEKCEFSIATTEFLGFVISPDGLRMDDAKIQVIRDWPVPRKVKDIQSFLGFANFYRRFIAKFSEITVPLTRLTRKDAPWIWSPACDKAFNLLKLAFSTAPILHHFDPALPPVVETDASDYAIAGILSLRTDDGEIRPVAFYARTLTGAELNYDTHDKELLAIFEAFKTWRHYLESPHHTIDVITDHKNLEYFSTTKTLSRRQA